ncbi:CotH kinase family protein [Flavobacterium sp.]|uniref:CotH kinase family protein n=1 Tax=Flavobacterium sp. TaxID=239 RepID=UPI0037504705
MNKKITLLLFFVGFVGYCQSLPQEMYYSADGKILFTGGQPQLGLYDPGFVKNVYLNFAQPDYWTQLTNNYASETNIPATMIYEGITYPDVGIRFRGNTSYTQIGTSQKKSFGVDMDFITTTQNLLGYSSLKFNNGHQDPSFMREVLYNKMARRYTPIAKGNFIHLFLNNQDWGLYPNVQAMDKGFLSQWFLTNDGALFRATPPIPTAGLPTWGDGTAGMNYLGETLAPYQGYYTLKSNDVVIDPWQKLVDACLSLSTASVATIDAVKTKIDVDKILWHLACENIFTDDDSYVMKGKMDYLAYYEAETARMTSLEIDGNSSFQAPLATNWTPFKNTTNVNYPLLNKLLNVPEWRQRYLAHYRTILSETFTITNANAIIDGMNAQIGALAASDPKKLYTTAEYTTEFNALKTFVTNRRAFISANAEVLEVAPIIASAKFYNGNLQEYIEPIANEVVNIKAVVTSASGINRINLYYATGIVGNFTKIQMFDDAAHNDGLAGDGTFGAQIPGYIAGTFVRYYVEAIANNASLSASYLPTGAEHDIFIYRVQQVLGPNGVVINEVMAQNTSTITDEVGDFEDWIELYNNNNFSVNLSGFYISDTSAILTKWQIPAGTIIPANGYLIVWADNEPLDGPLHANFRLSLLGESLVLSDPNLLLVNQVNFSTQTANLGFARVPNGTGGFVIQSPTYNANNSPLSNANFNELNQEIKVYPNPTSSIINVVIPNLEDNQKIKIYNQLGQLVTENEASNLTNIDISSLTSGTYLLSYANTTKKIIVIK